jgi:hypothetical protein
VRCTVRTLALRQFLSNYWHCGSLYHDGLCWCMARLIFRLSFPRGEKATDPPRPGFRFLECQMISGHFCYSVGFARGAIAVPLGMLCPSFGSRGMRIHSPLVVVFFRSQVPLVVFRASHTDGANDIRVVVLFANWFFQDLFVAWTKSIVAGASWPSRDGKVDKSRLAPLVPQTLRTGNVAPKYTTTVKCPTVIKEDECGCLVIIPRVVSTSCGMTGRNLVFCSQW